MFSKINSNSRLVKPAIGDNDHDRSLNGVLFQEILVNFSPKLLCVRRFPYDFCTTRDRPVPAVWAHNIRSVWSYENLTNFDRTYSSSHFSRFSIVHCSRECNKVLPPSEKTSQACSSNGKLFRMEGVVYFLIAHGGSLGQNPQPCGLRVRRFCTHFGH